MNRPRLLDLPHDYQTIVDEADWPLIRDLTLYRGGNGYVYFSVWRDGRSQPSTLHGLLMQPPSGAHVDHINGDKLDNRRANLRVVTPQRNQVNRRRLNRNNSSGVRGVDRAFGKWRAQITVNRKNHYLGPVRDQGRSCCRAPGCRTALLRGAVPMSRPKLLDLFAGAGGCSVGYHRAGFDVTGVDIEPHDDYPYGLIVADAMDVLADRAFLAQFEVVAVSPPCPRYSTITPAATRDQHPDLIVPVRDLLRAWGGIYVIENVPGAPLDHPAMLCGRAFGLRVRRHRLFESNVFLMSPGCACDASPPIGVYGDHPEDSHFLRPNGTERGRRARTLVEAQAAMGIDWMTDWDDLTDAIPPVYCEFIGEQLIDHLAVAA